MSAFINALQTNDSLTANGAITNSTTSNDCLNLFFIAGACRNMSEENINNYLTKAFIADKKLATVICFWAGDIRGGPGERRFFRIALKYIYDNYRETFYRNMDNVAHYNRWDSLFDFHNDGQVLEYVAGELIKSNSLLAKWMPREGKSKYQEFRKSFMNATNLSPKKYRKYVTTLSKTVEQQMSSKQFSHIQYKTVPSVAFNKYRKVFNKKDNARFQEFLKDVEAGKEKINASAIFPHDIYRSFKNGGDKTSINLQWNHLPNFLQNTEERILPLCDVSGSMLGLPMDIAVSLGIYISERNVGPFQNCFMTFSENPQLNVLSGSLVQRMQQLEKAAWGYNTDLIRAFTEILNKSRIAGINNNDMPTTLLIISDMEFDKACMNNSSTNFQKMKELYSQHGYELPKVVFWNVNAKGGNFPIKSNENGVALISGASPVVLKSVLSGNLNPMSVMLDTLNNSRYSKVIA